MWLAMDIYCLAKKKDPCIIPNKLLCAIMNILYVYLKFYVKTKTI